MESAKAAGVTISEWPESEKQRLMEGWKPLIADAMEFAKREGAPAQYMIDAMHPQRSPHLFNKKPLLKI